MRNDDITDGSAGTRIARSVKARSVSSAGRFVPVLCLVLLAVQPASALAYIDPNAGGTLFQLLSPLFAALIAGWVFMRKTIAEFFRSAWRRITGKTEQ